MSQYRAPLKEMRFVLQELAKIERVAQLPAYTEAGPEVVEAILVESAKFSGNVLDPLNRIGDQQGVRWSAAEGGSVSLPEGFKQAYAEFCAAGWMGLSGNPEYGGQGLPRLLAAAVQEMWKSSNMAFSLCPLLTLGAIEALELSGSAAQKAMYLPKMISGMWTGSMNLTEPQAGSDLAAIRTRAELQEDGTYRITGQKIFITYGDHDLTENIVHMVLARTPNAPAGVKGISLFVVPKFLVNGDGRLGARNDVYCVSTENKLGIHASPTCVMAYGAAGNFGGGAIGTLVGQENEGLKYMFIMMNAARYAVGLEGLALSERAYQHALAYARERVQSRDIAGSAKSVAIIQHPDVRRMLMLMKSQTEAMRALAYTVAAAHDVALHEPDLALRQQQQAYVDLMIPVVKGWLTETGNEIAALGVQIHGGMGFIEETGAAQYVRDARITTIYEGTTGIQANDLIGRKIAREGGATARQVLAQMRATAEQLSLQSAPEFAVVHKALLHAIAALTTAIDFIVEHYAQDVRATAVGAVPFLKLMGVVSGGWQLAQAALAAQRLLDRGDSDRDFLQAKIVTARFYADHVLSAAAGLAQTVIAGGPGALALDEAQF